MEFMIEEDMYEWSEKHDIPIKNEPCKKCMLYQETSIPFKKGNIVGLIAPLHDCGNDFCLVSATKIK